jgi:hypothetical protein
MHFRGDELQLVMCVSTVLPDGQEKDLKILVDTGAQANLVRKGVIPDWLMSQASCPLNLRTANGQRLDGGDRNVELSLGFQQVVRGEIMPQLIWRSATFFEADIRIDAILSFPWLVENGIGVFPHLKALSLLDPEFSLLFGLSKAQKKRHVRQFSMDRGYRMSSNWGDRYWHKGGRGRRRRWVQAREVVTVPWDDVEESKLQLGKLRLHLDPGEDEICHDMLGDEELYVVDQQLKKSRFASCM